MNDKKELNNPQTEEEKSILELKADIKQGKKDLREGNFITHEKMLLKLEKRGIIKKRNIF